MIPSGAHTAPRLIAIGDDADVSSALHRHVAAVGASLVCAPRPGDLEPLLRVLSPQVLVLLLPSAPDASWGAALTAAQGAARLGVKVIMVSPSREMVEPLAAVAGAQAALSRAEVLARPSIVLELEASPAAAPLRGGSVPQAVSAAPASSSSSAAPARGAAEPLTLVEGDLPPRRPRPPSADLLSLIDDELVEERPRPPTAARVEVSVSLVSEHNFYVGASRRIDSGGVFIATSVPPPVGTRVQVRLGLADGRRIDLEGEVAFLRGKSATTGRQPAGCGVRLHGLPGWSVDAIERFFLARQPIIHAQT